MRTGRPRLMPAIGLPRVMRSPHSNHWSVHMGWASATSAPT